MTNAADIVLLGDPVSQSRSPHYQNAGLRAIGSPLVYGVRQVGAEGVVTAVDELRRGDLVGVNVTAPHKALALSLADRATATAAATGAANTLWLDGGELWADNTDIAGVRASARALGLASGRSVVLGAGGAAAAAVLALVDAGPVLVVNRSVGRARELAGRLSGFGSVEAGPWGEGPLGEWLGRAALVVNATSLCLGDPAVARRAFASLPWPEECSAGLLDLSYASTPTPFLGLGGATTRRLDGATMLLHQGAAAFERWTGAAAPLEVMREALADALGRPSAAIA